MYEVVNVIWRKELTKKKNESWLIGHWVKPLQPFNVGEQGLLYNPTFPFNIHKTRKVKEILTLENALVLITSNAMYFFRNTN